jgi:hypothetical protein
MNRSTAPLALRPEGGAGAALEINPGKSSGVLRWTGNGPGSAVVRRANANGDGHPGIARIDIQLAQVGSALRGHRARALNLVRGIQLGIRFHAVQVFPRRLPHGKAAVGRGTNRESTIRRIVSSATRDVIVGFEIRDGSRIHPKVPALRGGRSGGEQQVVKDLPTGSFVHLNRYTVGCRSSCFPLVTAARQGFGTLARVIYKFLSPMPKSEGVVP